jgi:hypothetical protein
VLVGEFVDVFLLLDSTTRARFQGTSFLDGRTVYLLPLPNGWKQLRHLVRDGMTQGVRKQKARMPLASRTLS